MEEEDLWVLKHFFRPWVTFGWNYTPFFLFKIVFPISKEGYFWKWTTKILYIYIYIYIYNFEQGKAIHNIMKNLITSKWEGCLNIKKTSIYFDIIIIITLINLYIISKQKQTNKKQTHLGFFNPRPQIVQNSEYF